MAALFVKSNISIYTYILGGLEVLCQRWKNFSIREWLIFPMANNSIGALGVGDALI